MILHHLVASHLGKQRTDHLFDLLVIRPELLVANAEINRAIVAQALNMILFSDLLDRVPAARAYAADCRAKGARMFHDHGAVRTVVLDGMGDLPVGESSLVRVLEPLGYQRKEIYPLDRLKMTGRSYAQADYPEDIAQFFVSELHVDRFSSPFVDAARSVTSSSRDPLTPDAKATLAALGSGGAISMNATQALLPVLASCFARQHDIPRLSDYEALLAESAEMAWIATEGNAFNHATDRVEDVDAVSREQKGLGRPMKDSVEISSSGRVRQTAFHAAQVIRQFAAGDGTIVERSVPGSFYEFITRLPKPDDGRLDLGFDSSNAQAIFKMTAAGAAAA